MIANPKDYSSYDIAVEIAGVLTLEEIESQAERFLQDVSEIGTFHTSCILCIHFHTYDDNGEEKCDKKCPYEKFQGRYHWINGCYLYSKSLSRASMFKDNIQVIAALERYCMAYLIKGDK